MTISPLAYEQFINRLVNSADPAELERIRLAFAAGAATFIAAGMLEHAKVQEDGRALAEAAIAARARRDAHPAPAPASRAL